jgi:beta-fructofuranosidase
MVPAGDIESLREAPQHFEAMTLPANQEVVIDAVQGNAMEIIAEIAPGSSPMVEMNVLRSPNREEFTRIAFFRGRGFRGQSLISLDTSYASIAPDVRSRAPETGPIVIEEDEPLELRVFLDRSVVEVFINGKQCVAARVYPDREDSLGLSFRSQGVDSTLTSLRTWQMKNIWT